MGWSFEAGRLEFAVWSCGLEFAVWTEREIAATLSAPCRTGSEVLGAKWSSFASESFP